MPSEYAICVNLAMFVRITRIPSSLCISQSMVDTNVQLVITVPEVHQSQPSVLKEHIELTKEENQRVIATSAQKVLMLMKKDPRFALSAEEVPLIPSTLNLANVLASSELGEHQTTSVSARLGILNQQVQLTLKNHPLKFKIAY